MEEHQVLMGLEAPIARIIHETVLHHNAKELPKGLDSRVLQYARALRDADKLDILFILLSHYESGVSLGKILGTQLPDSGQITPKLLEAVRLGQTVPRTELISLDDSKLLLAGWVHDLNTRRAFQLFRQERFLERIFAILPQGDDLTQLYTHLKTLIEERSKAC
jgi:hypothetical protein